MKSFVPREKCSKKVRRQMDRAQRTGWGPISPVTRTTQNKKAYNRKRVDRREFTSDLSTRLPLFSRGKGPLFFGDGFGFFLGVLGFSL